MVGSSAEPGLKRSDVLKRTVAAIIRDKREHVQTHCWQYTQDCLVVSLPGCHPSTKFNQKAVGWGSSASWQLTALPHSKRFPLQVQQR